MGKRKSVAEFNGRVIARAEKTSEIVKSAQRVFEILEFFDDYRQEASVVQIAEALSYPQSSTSALLKSLVNTGYLRYDPIRRTYITSARVALLGSWLNASFAREGELIEMMRDLNEATGDAVILMTRNGLFAQYIHVIQAKDPAARRIGTGHLRPLATSGAGHACLSTLPDDEVVRLLMRINAEVEDPSEIVNIKDILTRLKDIRKVGYAVAYAKTSTCALVAAPLPPLQGQTPMMLGICGESESIKSRSTVLGATLLEAIREFFSKPHPVPYSAHASTSGHKQM